MSTRETTETDRQTTDAKNKYDELVELDNKENSAASTKAADRAWKEWQSKKQDFHRQDATVRMLETETRALRRQKDMVHCIRSKDDARLELIERKLEKLDTLDTLSETVRVNTETIGKVEEGLTNHSNELTDHSNELTAINDKIKRFERLVTEQTKNLKETERKTRLAEMDAARTEIKIVGIDFDMMMGNEGTDNPNGQRLVAYLFDTAKIDTREPIRIIDYKQFGKARVTSDEHGRERPRSAPVVLKFNTKEARALFWSKASRTQDKCWRMQDSDQERHRATAKNYRTKAKELKAQGGWNQTKVNIVMDKEVGFRYAVWKKMEKKDEWMLECKEKLDVDDSA